MVTSGASKATFSPGCTCRLATTPESGATAPASLSALRASWTCASADFTLPRDTLKLDSELSNAFCEMKFCLSSARLVVRVFSASASCARADSSAPMRSRSRASRSAVSIRDEHLACADRVAFAHRDLAHVAGNLGLDGRLIHRLQRCRTPAASAQAAALSTRREVGRAELEHDRRRRLPCLGRRRSSWPCARRRPPATATRTNSTTKTPRRAAMSIFRAMHAPCRDPPSGHARSDRATGRAASAASAPAVPLSVRLDAAKPACRIQRAFRRGVTSFGPRVRAGSP